MTQYTEAKVREISEKIGLSSQEIRALIALIFRGDQRLCEYLVAQQDEAPVHFTRSRGEQNAYLDMSHAADPENRGLASRIFQVIANPEIDLERALDVPADEMRNFEPVLRVKIALVVLRALKRREVLSRRARPSTTGAETSQASALRLEID